MSSIKQQITNDMKVAMKSLDKARLATIRLIQAAIKQREIDERIELTDEQTLAILDKMVKQRRESIKQFQLAARQSLIEQEEFEIGVIQTYLPVPLTDLELNQCIEAAISTSGAQSMKEMGKIMALLRPQVQGRADMGVLSEKIKQRLLP